MVLIMLNVMIVSWLISIGYVRLMIWWMLLSIVNWLLGGVVDVV